MMRLALALCVTLMFCTTASAGHHHGSSKGWSSWGQTSSWKGSSKSWSSTFKKHWNGGSSKGWSKNWLDDVDWSKAKKKSKKSKNKGWGKSGKKGWNKWCKPRKPKCKTKDGKKCPPPTGVPTPTAAFAGLAMMGVMLTRGRRKPA